MNKITVGILNTRVNYLNKITSNPEKTWVGDDSKRISAIGNYHIDEAYGSYSLYQIENENGGIRDIFNSGHITKSDLYNRINAFLNGINIAKER